MLEREETSSMGLFLGMLQAKIILRPVFNTARNMAHQYKHKIFVYIITKTSNMIQNLPNRRAMPAPVLSEAPPSMEVTLIISFCLHRQTVEHKVNF